MYNTSADDLERVASDLSQIARTYSNASQELEQHVITLEGAVSHVLSSGASQWKGLSSEAFVSAWLERRARLKQASMLMSESASYMTTMKRTIEENVPIIRAEQSTQLEAIFATMPSGEQQALLDAESQAQNTILMAMAALNSQLEALAEEVSDCPEVDREASYPGYYDNISRNDAGGESGTQTPEQRIEDAVGDPVVSQLLIDLANQNGANLEDVAALLENGASPDLINQWLQKDGDLADLKLLLENGASSDQIAAWFANGDVGVGNTITPFDGAIKKALRSRNPGDHLEGVVARIAKMAGYDVTEFQTKVYGSTGTITDIDVGVPSVIVEAKSGQSWDLGATTKLEIKLGKGIQGAEVNPDKNPVIIYAPNMPPEKVQWIKNTGAYVAQNPEQFINLLKLLSRK